VEGRTPDDESALHLVDRWEELLERLIELQARELDPDDRDRVIGRYREIVPLVLPAALHCLETGEPLPLESLAHLRRVAADAATDPEARLSIALRGAVPVFRVVAQMLRETPALDPEREVLLLTRAGVLAQELGAFYVESWSTASSARGEMRLAPSPAPVEDPDPAIRLVASSPELDEADEDMLAMAAHGMSNEQIATATSYSRQAVGWRFSRLMRAWRTPNRTALVAVAFVKGVLVARSARRAPRAIESGDQAGTRKSSAQDTSS